MKEMGKNLDDEASQLARMTLKQRLAALGHEDEVEYDRWCEWVKDDFRGDAPRIHLLGRPTLRSSRADRTEVLDILDELGPATSAATLQDCFPSMPRAELEDLLKRYRRVWRNRHLYAPHCLHWQLSGAVWAMDFSKAIRPIDALYPYLLAVRDLASHQQLLWLPVFDMTADITIEALRSLLVLHGAPFVMETDNGSAFFADATKHFFSPLVALHINLIGVFTKA
jgi:hypothetical protein